jgi:gamma-glutamylcyclotransferase (GGCT)/AIG2-like uncharacterized protein YtfP
VRAVPDTDFPADPYPGVVPPFSFVHLDDARIGGHSHPLTFDGCWRVGGAGAAELDLWLAGHGAPPLAARVPVLSYGSNRNPGKITWLRRALGLTGPVVVLRARTDGLAAVWASGFRARDGQRTSVLGAAPGASEQHAVWLATPEQVAVLDRCEGRGDRYRLARLGTGAVYTDDSLRIEAPWCYLGLSAIRRPLLVGGRPVRCADLGQAAAFDLDGEPAPDDGLSATTVHGAPDPDEWPAALFVYGTLQPGQPAWPLLAGHTVGRPRRATVAGRVCETGRGYPALLPDSVNRAPGWLVTLRQTPVLLGRLDRYEGDEYRRIRVAAVIDDGTRTACWTYVWTADEGGLSPVDGVWTA